MVGTVNIKKDFFLFLERYPEISVVCFDFFDTLVYRIVEPEHTKRLACKQLSLLFKNGMSGRELYQWRRNLEIDLCSKNAAEGKDPEFNISEFATAFYELLNHRFSELPPFLTADLFRDIFLKIEINIELRVQRIFDDTKEVLEAVRKCGLKTAVVSDFYVPAFYFQRFLDHNGFSSQVDSVFISSDFGLTKSSGRLYEKVIDFFNCPPESVAMIGDNDHSDIRMAEIKGIRAYHVNRKAQKAFYEKCAGQQRTRKSVTKKLGDNIYAVAKNQGGKIFPEIAITFWRFTYLLFKQLIRDGVQNIFFFSKEGEFLKTLFEQFQEDQFGGRIIKAHYLLVSRKSTFICSLRPLMEEDFSRIFHQYREISPRDFLLSLNFFEHEAINLCNEISVPYEKRLKNFPVSDTFVSIVQSQLFAEIYESKRQHQKKNLIKYLNSFGVDFKREGFNIVDVGWKGSIQDNIYFSLGKKIVVNGYYIGLMQPTNLSESNRKTGILFSESPIETQFFEVYNSNRSLFEMLLDATHGSADGYYAESELKEFRSTTTDNTVMPVSKQSDICVKILDLPDERKLFIESIQPIQKRILSVCKKINRMTTVTDAPLPSIEWFARQHARMIYRPTKHEIGFFKSLYHLENFGIFEFTQFRSNGNLSLQERMKNLKSVIKDPETVLKTGIWAPIVLERLGLAIYRQRFGNRCYRRIFSNGSFFSNFLRKDKTIKGWNRIKPKRIIKIAFLLGIPEINGGTYVIFEHAARLKQKGYRVFILTQGEIHPSRYAWHPDAGKLEWLTFENAKHLKFDFAVATWWMSALFLRLIKAHTYLYFVQSIESRFFPEDEQATYEEMAGRRLSEKTYLLPLPMITEARWIKLYLRENYGHDPLLVLNGIRKDIYTDSGISHSRRTPGRLRVLVEGPLGVDYKNVERTIALCRRSDADEVWLLTASAVDNYPGVDRVFSQVPIWETPPIYRSCDVLVKLSYIEGMFGPPLEMFHCGGTAIVYNVTGHDEYIRHDVNGFVVQMDDENAVVERLNLLKRRPEELERLKNGARKTAMRWPDWDTASRHFEKALRQLNGRTWPNQAYLSKITDYLWQQIENDVNNIKLLPFYRESKPKPQCCQIFWHFGEGFSESASQKIDYESGKWVSLKAQLELSSSGPVYLRIDPCTQIGVIFIESILISESRCRRSIKRFNSGTQWEGTEVGGTATLIDGKSALIIEANGSDPQIILSPFEIEGEDSGIVVEVTMKFLPFPLAVRELLQTLGARERVDIE